MCAMHFNSDDNNDYDNIIQVAVRTVTVRCVMGNNSVSAHKLAQNYSI